MRKAWQIIKVYLPLLIEIFGDLDIQAIKSASDKKAELLRQLRDIFKI